MAGEGAGEQGKGGKGKRNKGPRMGKQKKPLEAALADLKLHRHMLRLMPSIAAAAAAQAAAEAAGAAAAAAAAAAASGDRAAAAALWGGSAAAAAADAACAAAAEAEDQLKLRHVGDLLQLDMKPVLPEDDDWLNDIVWDAQEAAAAAAAGAAASGALRQQQLARSVSSLASGFEQVGLGEQEQALVVRQPGGGGAAGRAAVLWDLNDPYMVFEAHSTQPYANASAMMHPVPAQVRTLSADDWYCLILAKRCWQLFGLQFCCFLKIMLHANGAAFQCDQQASSAQDGLDDVRSCCLHDELCGFSSLLHSMVGTLHCFVCLPAGCCGCSTPPTE
jgi:hypothetical protein